MTDTYINHKNLGMTLLVLLMIISLQFTISAQTTIDTEEITPLSERTAQVAAAIVAATGAPSPENVTNEQIAEITALNLRDKEISVLKSGDFSGMTKLENLNLYDNQLRSLPDGIFKGLTALTTLRLGKNTVEPMLITVTLERVAANEFKANVPTGAPFSIVVPVSVTNGIIDGGATTLTISTGEIYSGSLTVTRTAGTTDDVTADIGTLPNLPSTNHYGYTLTKPDSLPILIHRHPSNAVDPVFSEGTTTTRSVAENTVAGQNIGTPVEATDDNEYTLTYSLSGTDAASYDIVSTSGQLQTKVALDYETKSSYSVTITATNTVGLTDTISVTINVTDVNEAPVFSSVSTTLSVAENTVAGTNIGSPITATDEDNDTLSYRLSGTDSASFDIVSTSGQLQTKAALDYETKNVYYVSVIVSDGSLTGSIAITINITNIEEEEVNNAPVFTDGDSTTRSVQENTAAGVNIGSAVSATDSDNDTITYSLSGTDVASFDIVSTSGQLQTKAALDYETKSSYSVIITAKDTEDQSVTITVTINVTDVNEAPVFSSDSLTLSIAENTEAGVNIGSAVTATDDDGDILTYSLSGTDAASFDIVNSTGQIRTDASLDYESKNSYSVTVTATDGDDATDTIAVTINVTNVTESGENVAPIFTEGESTTRRVSENISSGTNIGPPVTATDADSDELTYTLNGTDKASFSIDSTTGQLKTKDDLDYETKSTYAVTVTVTDSSDLANTKSINVRINVLDAEEAPVFAFESIIRSVAENTAKDVNIGSAVSATDDDGDRLTYSLSGDDASSFSLDSATGQLSTSEELDYEDKRVYSVKVTASDGTLTDSVNVTIRVTNVHEPALNNYPEFVEGISTTRSVRENPANHTAIGDTVNADDSDGDQLTFTVGGSDGASFTIDSDTGQLRTKVRLDFETKASYTVTVTASDGNGGSVSIDVTINVIDVLESTPLTERTNSVALGIQNAISDMQIDTTLGINDTVLSEITTVTVPSSSISTFKSGDFSGLTSLTNLIIEDNLSLTSIPSDIFDGLSSLEGLSLSGSSLLESLPSDVFDNLEMLETLRLVGNGLNSLPNDIFDELTSLEVLNLSTNSLTNLSQSTFQKLTQLQQLNLSHNSIRRLSPDLFSNLSQLSTLHINNNKLSSLPIGVFDGLTSLDSVNIQQDGTQLSLSISLAINGADEIKASVDTGATFDIQVPVIVTNGSIDQNTSTLTIPTGKLESDNVISVTRTTGTTAAVTVEIETLPSIPTNHSGYTLSRSSSDEVEVIPAIDGGSNSAPVFSDGSSTTRSIAENTAAGVNIGSVVSATDADDDTLTYSLSGTDAASFAIDSTTGQLKTKAALDYETKSSFSVTVTASDGNSGSDSISVTISVTDANDAPTFASDSVSRSVAENTDADTVIGDPITATDEDGDTLTYSLGGTDASSFAIDSTTGQLKTKAALDYESKSSYSVTVTATDADSGSGSISVTINITDVAEVTNNAPEFTEGNSASRSVVENTDAGQNIGRAVSATDSDEDTLTYSLGGTDAASFVVDTSNGQLKTKTHLNYETKNSYSVVVTVSDGSQTDTISITINVTDVNEAPVFASNSATRSIDENTAADTNIGNAITASDDDGDTLTYTLSGTDAASFAIDSTSGQLSTKTALDYEVKKSYSVTITATDSDSETGSIAVTINVNDVSDVNPPIFNVTGIITISVAEKTAADTKIGDPVTAKRLPPITYSLTGTHANKFSINSRTGQISTKAALDYETKNSYTVRVVATNSDGRATKDVTINVTDVLESTPLSERTSQVMDAIIAAIDGVSSAADVTDTHLSNIKTLNLSNKSIISLTTNDFEGLSSLEELDLGSNPVGNLENGVFDDLSSLKKLNLESLGLTSLPSDVFDDLSSLRELKLTSNSISRLPGDIFDDLTSLKKLYLNVNDLSSLASTLFQKLSSLTDLDIRNNQLSRLPNNIFKGLSSINAIKAESNSVDPLVMTISLEADTSNQVSAKVNTGLPYTLTVPVIITIREIESSFNLRILKGTVTSENNIEILTVGQGGRIKYDIDTLSTIPSRFSGLSLVKSANLPLTVISDVFLPGGPNSGEGVPDKTVLLSNYPNPFNPETWIPYQLSKASDVTMTISNIRGVVVRELALGHQPAGYYRNRARAAFWDGRNNLGEKVSTGVYFYTFKAGDFTATRRMLILK